MGAVDHEQWERATAMLSADAAAQALGIRLVEAELGLATVTMAVTPAVVNGLGMCHGGVMFTLADTAMAIASNSCGVKTLASAATIEFLAPAQVGDTLTATCRELLKPGRSAVNDAVVVNQHGDTLAVFRGRTISVGER